MKNIFTIAFFSILSVSCSASDVPAVGLLEQIPVMGKEYKVIARPIYIFSNKKLNEPTVFTGMVGTDKPYVSVCCYQVKDISPLDIKQEIKKYGQDEEFGSHMGNIRGYAYLYAAQPLSDKSKWTSLMLAMSRKTANPADGSPFSAPVVAEAFSTEQIPATIGNPPNQTTLHTRYDEKSDRMIFTFQQGKQKIVISEPVFAD
jgi:hypothetical protein